MRNSELKQIINMAYEMAESMYQTPYGQYFAQKGVKPFTLKQQKGSVSS